MKLQIGCHVSIAGGVWNAPKLAADLGCETFQIFSRSPRGGVAPAITKEDAKRFNEEMGKYGFTQFVIHGPYIINFGSSNPKTYNGSIKLIREDLERGSILGAKFVMFHVGSGKDLGNGAAIKQAKAGIKKVLDGYKGSTKLLLEIAAGAGEVLGDTFEELAELMGPVKNHSGFGGICYDTQHAFASGYDIRTPKATVDTFKKLEKTVGFEALRCIQVNDSKTEFESHKDRHEHIGDGKIGTAGFKSLIEFLSKKKSKTDPMALILETEHDKVEADIKKLKDLRNKSLK